MRTVIHSLEVIHKSQNVPVAHGDSLQHCNLISDLESISLASDFCLSRWTNHVFSTSHKPLVDHLCSIVSPSVNVYALFDHRVTTRTQCLPRLVSAWLYLGLCLRRMRPRAVRGHFRSLRQWQSTSNDAVSEVKWLEVHCMPREVGEAARGYNGGRCLGLDVRG